MSNQTEDRRAFDLTALADEFERRSKSGDKRFEKFRIAIEEYESACSILRDLKASEKSIKSLMTVQVDDTLRNEFSQPLFTHAVLCYCRALVSKTNARRLINVENKAYDRALRAKHDAIKDLRSTALAHYHVGQGKYGDLWNQDRVVAVIVDDEIAATDVYGRTNFLAAAVGDLFELLRAAIPFVWKERLRRSHVLSQILGAALTDDPQFVARMESHLFDPSKFYPPEYDLEIFWRRCENETEVYNYSNAKLILP